MNEGSGEGQALAEALGQGGDGFVPALPQPEPFQVTLDGTARGQHPVELGKVTQVTLKRQTLVESR